MSECRYKDVIYQYVKWARVESGLPFLPMLGVLKDNRKNSLCVKNLNKQCTNQFCVESHALLEIELDTVYKKGESFLMYEHLQIALTEVYGTAFLWKQGIFISKYFEQYGELRRVTTRRDPMTWKNETVRTEQVQELRFTILCLPYHQYKYLKIYALQSAYILEIYLPIDDGRGVLYALQTLRRAARIQSTRSPIRSGAQGFVLLR